MDDIEESSVYYVFLFTKQQKEGGGSGVHILEVDVRFSRVTVCFFAEQQDSDSTTTRVHAGAYK